MSFCSFCTPMCLTTVMRTVGSMPRTVFHTFPMQCVAPSTLLNILWHTGCKLFSKIHLTWFGNEWMAFARNAHTYSHTHTQNVINHILQYKRMHANTSKPNSLLPNTHIFHWLFASTSVFSISLRLKSPFVKQKHQYFVIHSFYTLFLLFICTFLFFCIRSRVETKIFTTIN